MTTDEIMALADALSQAVYNLATPDHYDHEARDEARAALLAEVEQLTLDALRYRWLREQNSDLDAGFYVGDETDALPEDITWIGSDLDAAIDAAMQPKE